MVSVIIPNYNHVKFLKERIESVLSQTILDIELIILDDNSQDESLAIIESFRNHEKVKVILVNEINSGSTFIQWERGLRYCTYDWVWIAESDDVASPLFLEELLDRIDSDVVLAFCQSVKIDEYGNKIGLWHTQTGDSIWRKDFTMDGMTFIKEYLICQNHIPNASGVIFRRNKAVQALDCLSTYRINGDWFLWTFLLRQGKVVYCSDFLNKTRFHGGKGSSKSIRHFLNILDTYFFYSSNSDLLELWNIKKLTVDRVFYNWKIQAKDIKPNTFLFASEMIAPVANSIDGLIYFRIFKYNLKVFVIKIILMIKQFINRLNKHSRIQTSNSDGFVLNANSKGADLDDLKIQRYDVINFLLNKIPTDQANYLEIGVRNPMDNFEKIIASNKFSVDPGIEFQSNPVDFPFTSDVFFEKLGKGEVLNKNIKFSVIFIDGLHHADQVYRDVENSLKYLDANGFIVIHDCNPPTEAHARFDFADSSTCAGMAWNGSVWKCFFKYRSRLDVFSCCIDADWGVGVISKNKNLGPPTRVVNEFFDYGIFDQNRVDSLNLMNFNKFKAIFD
jgi:glycosyltransferase involved in cell wall biosynthesis